MREFEPTTSGFLTAVTLHVCIIQGTTCSALLCIMRYAKSASLGRLQEEKTQATELNLFFSWKFLTEINKKIFDVRFRESCRLPWARVFLCTFGNYSSTQHLVFVLLWFLLLLLRKFGLQMETIGKEFWN